MSNKDAGIFEAIPTVRALVNFANDPAQNRKLITYFGALFGAIPKRKRKAQADLIGAPPRWEVAPFMARSIIQELSKLGAIIDSINDLGITVTEGDDGTIKVSAADGGAKTIKKKETKEKDGKGSRTKK